MTAPAPATGRPVRQAHPVTLRELEDSALEELYSLLLVLRRRERRPISDAELSRLERALDAALVTIYAELVHRTPGMTVPLTNLLDPDGPPIMATVDGAGRWAAADGAK